MASFSPSDYTLFFTFMAVSLLLFFVRKKARHQSDKLPPGPPGLPIVGNLLQFIQSGKSFIHYVRELRPIYGPILTLRLGFRTFIVISGPDLIHEALVERGQLFASRPPETSTRAVYSCEKFTVNSALYGPVWRSLRRNMVSNMLTNARLKGFSEVRRRAMDRLVDRLRADAEAYKADSKTDVGAVHVLQNARFAVFCILLSMCFGVDMAESEIVSIESLMKKVLIVTNFRLDDFLPLLRPLFRKKYKEAMQIREEQIKLVLPFIHRRRAELKDPDPNTKSLSFAYLDTLFDLAIEGRSSSPSDAEIVTLCSEFLNGGTDTTATAIEWAVALLIAHPEIQAKLHDEIKQVVGGKVVDEKDIDKLPYLNAFVKELLRLHPPTHMALSHAVLEETTLGGYYIPAGVNVEFYLMSVSEDRTRWADPERFDPERFMGGKDEGDVIGGAGLKMIPFGVGRRICPGLSMAMLHICLLLARMVQEFEWSALPSQEKIDFSEKVEFTVVMKTPLQAVIRPRN
ncbi:hypothetical protein ACLOJK_020742 [Asimina triloba]